MYNVSPTIFRIESYALHRGRHSFHSCQAPFHKFYNKYHSRICALQVADVHDKMEAVDLGDDITKNHINVQVTMEDGSVRPCRGVLTFSTSLVLYLLKVEIITAKASFNISLCNSKSSTGQNYVEKRFKVIYKMQCALRILQACVAAK